MSTSTQRIQTTLNNSVPAIAIGENTTASYAEELTTSTSSDGTTNTPIKKISDTNLMIFNVTSTPITPTLNTTVKNCKRGFVLNEKGNCQLKLNNTSTGTGNA